MNRRYPSPLRYPGGKGKVANFFKLLFIDNGFIGYGYAEPYAGGASVAIALLLDNYASNIYINDIDPNIYAFWSTAVNNTDELCQKISDTKVSIEEWHRQKSILLSPTADTLDRAFATFFMNRTNRSGIIQAGVIGGFNQKGDWKLDARYNKPTLIARLERIGELSDRISVTGLDAQDFLQFTVPKMAENTLLYLDPPYYQKGGQLYEHFYKHHDHVNISEKIKRLSIPWVVSYDCVEPITDIYSDFGTFTYSLQYSAGESYRGSEVMIFSPQVSRPQCPNPSKVLLSEVDNKRKNLILGSIP